MRPVTPAGRPGIRPRKYSRPEFNQLELFIRVAETGSFSATARMTGITQPAVSKAISRLEEIYGCLFERRPGKGLALTRIGEAILPSARILLHTVDELMVRAAAAAQGRTGILRIGIQSGVEGPVDVAVRKFMDQEIGTIHLVEGTRSDLEAMLRAGEIDMMTAVAAASPADPEWIRELLWKEQLSLVMPEAHALAKRASLNWKDVARIPLIFSSREDADRIAGRVRSRGIEASIIRHHRISRDRLYSLVVLGLGATIVQASSQPVATGTRAIPIADDDALEAIEAVWPAMSMNSLRDRFMSIVRLDCSDEFAD